MPLQWRYATGQATGSVHEKLNAPCQDRLACEVIADEVTLVAALADGAGSAAHAHLGAELAVSTVTAIVKLGIRAGRTDHVALLREAASLARERVAEEARNRNVPARELSSTLLAVIVAPVGGAALQIGDGVIVIREQQGNWRWVCWPQKGEYANATRFLSEADALESAYADTLPNEVCDVALMSDGLEALALHYATRTAHEPFFRTAFRPVLAAEGGGELATLSSSLTQFLASPAVRARTDDDASLILATRRPRET